MAEDVVDKNKNILSIYSDNDLDGIRQSIHKQYKEESLVFFYMIPSTKTLTYKM